MTLVTLVTLVTLAAPLAAVDARTVLRTASEDSRPKFLLDIARDKPGIAVELLQAIERLDPELQFVGHEIKRSSARVVAELESGQLDIFVGLARTESREPRLTYLQPPLYHVIESFFVRADDPLQVTDLRGLINAGGDVAVWEGTAQAEYLRKTSLPIAGETKSVEQALHMLVTGRARYYYGNEMSTAAEAIRLGLQPRIRVALPHFRNGRYIVIRKSLDPDLVRRLSAALRTLDASGELKRIFMRYCEPALSAAQCERSQ